MAQAPPRSLSVDCALRHRGSSPTPEGRPFSARRPETGARLFAGPEPDPNARVPALGALTVNSLRCAPEGAFRRATIRAKRGKLQWRKRRGVLSSCLCPGKRRSTQGFFTRSGGQVRCSRCPAPRATREPFRIRSAGHLRHSPTGSARISPSFRSACAAADKALPSPPRSTPCAGASSCRSASARRPRHIP